MLRQNRFYNGVPQGLAGAYPLDSADALVLLRDRPSWFMRQHRVTFESRLDGSGPRQAWFGAAHNRYAGNIEYIFCLEDRGAAAYTSAPVRCNVFALETIPINAINDIGRLPAVDLPGENNDLGISFLCTAALSGCCIVMQERSITDGGPFIAHIKPEGMSGEQLQDLLADARFAGSNAPTRLYGKRDYGDSPYARASAVAVLAGNAWTLYAQQFLRFSDNLADDLPGDSRFEMRPVACFPLG